MVDFFKSNKQCGICIYENYDGVDTTEISGRSLLSKFTELRLSLATDQINTMWCFQYLGGYNACQLVVNYLKKRLGTVIYEHSMYGGITVSDIIYWTSLPRPGSGRLRKNADTTAFHIIHIVNRIFSSIVDVDLVLESFRVMSQTRINQSDKSGIYNTLEDVKADIILNSIWK